MEGFWGQPATFRHFLEQQASEEQGFTLGLGAFEQPVYYFPATPTDAPNNLSPSRPEDTSLTPFLTRVSPNPSREETGGSHGPGRPGQTLPSLRVSL